MLVEDLPVIVRPVDDGWVMGEDWHIVVPDSMTVPDLKEFIEENHTYEVSQFRMNIRMEDGEYLPDKKIKWNLRRLGVKPGYVFRVEPTLSGAWTWQPMQYYQDKLIADVRLAIENSPTKRLTVAELRDMVIIPRPVKVSLQVFIRTFPEYFHVYNDSTSGDYWVHLPAYIGQLPMFGDTPVDLGQIVHFEPTPFDWEAHADINDTKRLELDFDIPDVQYELAVMAGRDMKRADVFGSSDPFGIITFNGVEVGRTGVRKNTLNPEWRDAKFILSVSASIEIEDCVLLVEMFDMDSGGGIGEDQVGDFLGAVELTGLALVNLLADGRSNEVEYPLEQRPESAPEEDQSDVKGFLKLKGGKVGYEVRVVSANNLLDLGDKLSKPFAIMLWNGDFLGSTLPEQRSLNDPIWDETVFIPTLNASQKLEECELEIQVWGNSKKNPAEKADFLGSAIFKEEGLVSLFEGNKPWATFVRKTLTQSKNIPIKFRKKPVRGFMCLQGGPAGLAMQPGKKVELTLQFAERLAKVQAVDLVVDWNYMQIYRGNSIPLDNGSFNLGHSLRMETDAGLPDCYFCHLRLELWESRGGRFQVGEPEYLGQIIIEKEELMELMDQRLASTMKFDWASNEIIDMRRQRLIRGNITLRGGVPGARAEEQRILIIKAARNLARANIMGSSDPMVEVSWNGVVIGRTPVIEGTQAPVWNDEKFFLTIPPMRDFTEKELKKFIRENEARKAKGLDPIERNVYDELVLDLDIYDADASGNKSLFLGGMRFTRDSLIDFFESFDPLEKWVPLGSKNVRICLVGKDSEISISTPGLKWASHEQWLAELDAIYQAERARIEQEKADAIADELARLERQRQEEERAAQEEQERLEEEARLKAEREAAEEKAAEDRILAQKAEEAARALAEREKLDAAFAELQADEAAGDFEEEDDPEDLGEGTAGEEG